MKSRMIRPEFFQNADLGALHPVERLLFAGLWCIADREGILEDNPIVIKGQILPYDEISVDMALQRLYATKHIIRYAIEHERTGLIKRYIWIPNFRKFQPIHPNEAKSKYPSYQEGTEIPCNYQELHLNSRELQGYITSTLISSSTSTNIRLSDDKLLSQSEDSDVCAPDPEKQSTDKREKTEYPEWFENWWKTVRPTYPARARNRSTKNQVFKVLKSLNSSRPSAEKMVDVINRRKMSEDWRKSSGQYVPGLHKFIKTKPWEDDDQPVTGQRSRITERVKRI